MARMSIDDSVARDPRITLLAESLGWSRREVVGCLVQDVWPICYDQVTHMVSPRLIDTAAKHVGFAEAMLECELATRDRSGKLVIAGAKERVKYIKDKQDAGREGGTKSAESRAKTPKQAGKQEPKQPEASRNPIPIVPDSASASASAPVPDSVLPPVPDRKRPAADAASESHQPAVAAFDAYFRNANQGAKPKWDGVRISQLKHVVKSLGVDEVVRRIRVLETSPPKFPPPPWDLPTFVQHIDKIASASQSPMQYLLDVANGVTQ